MNKPAVFPVQIIRFQNNDLRHTEDLLVVEEPLEIRLGYGEINDRKQSQVSVTMRTPGHDFELALGFLYSEGIIKNQADIQSIHYCTELGTQEQHFNIVRVELKEKVRFEPKSLQRNFYTTSSCGVCGKASIDAVFQHCDNVIKSDFCIQKETLMKLPDILRNQQSVFNYTGGLHGCALMNVKGEVIVLREDIGRHNAVDKVIGAVLSTQPEILQNSLLMLSGRAGFELLQKAAMAGIPFVASVGAPSSLSVETAKAAGITLAGFLKNDRFNIYCGEQRIS